MMSNLRWLRRLMVATRQGVSREAGRNFAKGIFRVPQFAGDGRPRIARAGGVNQDADGDAALDGAGEGGDKLFARCASLSKM